MTISSINKGSSLSDCQSRDLLKIHLDTHRNTDDNVTNSQPILAQ